jgi:PKD domain
MPQIRRLARRLKLLLHRSRNSRRAKLIPQLLQSQMKRTAHTEALEPRQVAGSMLLSLPAPLSIFADSGDVRMNATNNTNSPTIDLRSSKSPANSKLAAFKASFPAKLESVAISRSFGGLSIGPRSEMASHGIQLKPNGTVLSGVFQPLKNGLLEGTFAPERNGGLTSAGIGGLSSGSASINPSGTVWSSVGISIVSDGEGARPVGRDTSHATNAGGGGGSSPEGETPALGTSQTTISPTTTSQEATGLVGPTLTIPSTSDRISNRIENSQSTTTPSSKVSNGKDSSPSTQTSTQNILNNSSPNSNTLNVPPTVTPRGTRQVLDFDNHLEDWDIRIEGGSEQGKGSVTHGSALLREGNSFLVGLSQEFIVPARPITLSFTYSELVFDTTDPDSINDAFEASVLDSSGRSLVHTIGDGRESFFNVTEGESIAVASGATAKNGAVTVDISQLEPGSRATIVFRLVNNDQDTDTRVRISTVELSGDAAPVATIELETDTAPNGVGSDPYRVDLLTNRLPVIGQFSDDDRVAKLEAQMDDGAKIDITSSMTNGRYRFDPGTLPVGTHRIAIHATDTAGQTTVASLDFRVNNPPVAKAGSDISIPEGTALQLDASASFDAEDPIFSRHWNLTDGTTTSNTVITRTYLNNGIHSERLSVVDTAGSVVEDSIVVTVENVPPSLDNLPNQVVLLKQPVVVHSVFSDPGVNDKHFATINWGDGLVEPAFVDESNGSGWFFSTHNYATTGLYNASLTLRDEDGGQVVKTFTVDVQSTPVQITPTLALDDREFGYSERGTWQNGTTTAGYKNDFRFALPGTGTRTATWSVRVPAGQYEVFTTWVADSRHASNTPYRVFDSTTLLTPSAVPVDQKSTPSDFTHGGVGWKSLGVFNFAKGLPIIRVNDAADGRVVADAIMIARRTTAPPEIKVDLRLANDTALRGVTADGRTSDPTIIGAIGGLNDITSLTAGFVSPTYDILSKLVNGRITIKRSDLELIHGGPLVDGTYTLFVRAGDSANQAKIFQLAFQLDTSVPLVAVGLPNETELPNIQVDITSEPGARVRLLNTDELKSAGSTGLVSFLNVPLAIGDNEIKIEATDRAGNIARQSISIRRSNTDSSAPVLDVKLIADTGLVGDQLTNDPRIQGTVLDASRIIALRAGIDITQTGRFADLLPDLRNNGQFILTTNRLREIASGTLADGPHILRLTATDALGLQSPVFEYQFTQDTQSPRAATNLQGSLLGTVTSMDIVYDEVMSVSAFSATSYLAEQVNAAGEVETTVPISNHQSANF